MQAENDNYKEGKFGKSDKDKGKEVMPEIAIGKPSSSNDHRLW
jgi:hypothetical protein